MTSERLRIGKLGEAEAGRRLEQAGYEIRSRNWRCRSGEIDIVARQGDTFVFVEVRSRGVASGARYGTAAESVDFRKQAKVRGIAQLYLQQHRLHDVRVRFDVIAITVGKDEGIESYTHYEAAF
ncbi:YraN family protein [Paenibacillus sp. LHD-117]|uniref:YraN family protein n=1 Tax=Paenibacillus sp. LHD-117 TaxID=3071412 RepID=UPI0027E10670|nr:YraN family protein [Paenibacillus sp. LHD-117]MDQ6419274.1 YraN family protein [Paenibacillus sp. LHD-117]